MRKKKKAQLTLFIILGLALVLIFLIMYYTIGISSIPPEKEETAIEPKPLDPYISQCLENTLYQGLILLGKQGGVLYKDQGSIIIRTEKRKPLKFGEDEVAYLIKRHSTPSETSYGKNLLLFLTKNQGSLSIQEQLEKYISINTEKCVNFPELKKLPELAAYEITEGSFNSEIIFGANDVTTKLNIPADIKINEKQTSKTLSYTTKANVRFRRIYDAIKQTIQKDNTNLDYSIAGQFNELLDAEITKQELLYDDIFIITDSQSTIKGNPFLFQFAVENRYPVLNMQNIEADEGDTLIVSPNAKDPDEDEITYTYESGWRSSEFQQQTPSFELGDSDTGTHNVKITASDGQLQDSQEIEIHIS